MTDRQTDKHPGMTIRLTLCDANMTQQKITGTLHYSLVVMCCDVAITLSTENYYAFHLPLFLPSRVIGQ